MAAIANVYLVHMYKKGSLPPNDYQIQTISTTYNMSQTTINHLSFEEDIDTCGSLGPFRVNHPNHGSLHQNSTTATGTVSSITGGIKGTLATSDSLGWSNADLGCNLYEASSLETPNPDTNEEKMDLSYQGKILEGRRIVQNRQVADVQKNMATKIIIAIPTVLKNIQKV